MATSYSVGKHHENFKISSIAADTPGPAKSCGRAAACRRTRAASRGKLKALRAADQEGQNRDQAEQFEAGDRSG